MIVAYSMIFFIVTLIIILITCIYFFYKTQYYFDSRIGNCIILQHPSEIPGSWNQAFAALYIPKEGYIIAHFQQGMDFLSRSYVRHSRYRVILEIKNLRDQDYVELDANEYAARYGVQRGIE